MENQKPKGVRLNLKEIVKKLSEAYWVIDSIERRFKKDLDGYWVTLPYLNKLKVVIEDLNDFSSNTIDELEKKIEEFRTFAMYGEEK